MWIVQVSGHVALWITLWITGFAPLLLPFGGSFSIPRDLRL
jgi:hypothetical protein